MASLSDLPALQRAVSVGFRDVLLIDDDPALHHLVAATLGPGVTLRWAFDGVTGLALARRVPPGLILLDYVLPELHGAQVCEQVRADPALRGVRILLLAA
jgi:DNA-binding response OmpR family regulator